MWRCCSLRYGAGVAGVDRISPADVGEHEVPRLDLRNSGREKGGGGGEGGWGEFSVWLEGED